MDDVQNSRVFEEFLRELGNGQKKDTLLGGFRLRLARSHGVFHVSGCFLGNRKDTKKECKNMQKLLLLYRYFNVQWKRRSEEKGEAKLFYTGYMLQ